QPLATCVLIDNEQSNWLEVSSRYLIALVEGAIRWSSNTLPTLLKYVTLHTCLRCWIGANGASPTTAVSISGSKVLLPYLATSSKQHRYMLETPRIHQYASA